MKDRRLVVACVIFWGGFLLRLGAEATVVGRPEPLPPLRPLSELEWGALGPRWSGEDVAVPERVADIAGVADHTYRRYTDGAGALALWVGYVTGGASSGLHYPSVCFPRQGFRLEERRVVSVPGTGLGEAPRFYETIWSDPVAGHAYCLYTFYYLGRFEPDETDLRLADRFPGLPYYAIISLVGEFSGSLRETRALHMEALRNLLPELLKHFPDTGHETSGEPPRPGGASSAPASGRAAASS